MSPFQFKMALSFVKKINNGNYLISSFAISFHTPKRSIEHESGNEHQNESLPFGNMLTVPSKDIFCSNDKISVLQCTSL